MLQRIQRSRVKGWRTPPGCLYIGRPSIFGNPFTPGECREHGWQGTDDEIRERCASAFRVWLLTPHWREVWDSDESEQRRGRIIMSLPRLAEFRYLSCWCPVDRACHGDSLIEAIERMRGLGAEAFCDTIGFDYEPCLLSNL